MGFLTTLIIVMEKYYQSRLAITRHKSSCTTMIRQICATWHPADEKIQQ